MIRNSVYIFSILAICLFASSCKSNIKILGLKQDGSQECPDGERVYLYRDAEVGICLNEAVVIFTHCVSELSVSSTHVASSAALGVRLSGLQDYLATASISPEQKHTAIKEFAAGGELEKARAEAIRGCMRLAKIPQS
jgi:hypothetical protein